MKIKKRTTALFYAIGGMVIFSVMLFFFLKEKVIATPDYLGSDAIHVNYSLKYYLISMLRSGQIPFWTHLIQGGYPIFAEGQMGTLFLPNIFAAFICGPTYAYPFLLSISILFLMLGMFFILQKHKLSVLSSVLLSANFAWMGPIIFGWVHLTIIQTYSVMPFLFLAYMHYLETKNRWYGFVFSHLLAQMYFAGTIQMVFIALFGIIIYTLFQKGGWRMLGRTLIWIFLGTCFALPQLLPSYQLHTLSSRSELSGYAFATSVPFHFNHLIGLFNYAHLGTPFDGTYPLDWKKYGIFWENTPYVGHLFFIVFIICFLYTIFLKKGNKYVHYVYLLLLFITLSLGDISPLYFIFDIPPFSLFRVTGRYMFMGLFFMYLFMGSLMLLVEKKHLFSCIVQLLLIINVLHLVGVAYSYNLFLDRQQYNSSVQRTFSVLKKDAPSFMTGFGDVWNLTIGKKGWKNKDVKKSILFLTSLPFPNVNLLSGTASFNYGNVGLTLRRPDAVSGYLESLLFDSHASDKKKQDMFSLYGVDNIITFTPLQTNEYSEQHIATSGAVVVYVYSTNTPKSDVYAPSQLKEVRSFTDINGQLNKFGISQVNGIIENHRSIQQNSNMFTFSHLTSSSQGVILKVSAETEGMIVYKMNWYPEWKAFIDDKEVPIFRTNITQMGIEVPKGVHRVRFEFVPSAFYLGLSISLSAFLLCVVLLFIIPKTRKNQA